MHEKLAKAAAINIFFCLLRRLTFSTIISSSDPSEKSIFLTFIIMGVFCFKKQLDKKHKMSKQTKNKKNKQTSIVSYLVSD